MTRLHGLYAITDNKLTPSPLLLSSVEQAIRGGARIIQYRDKSHDSARRFAEARQLQSLCQQHDALLIINDDVALAAEINAAGVHLGQNDTTIETARQQLPKGIIGISCYNDWQLAEAAAVAGADYVAFGAFFPSTTKPGAKRAGIELLQRAKQVLDIPVVAIGGISRENAGQLVAAGADMLAMVRGVFGQPDIYQAARQYAQLFEH